MEWWEDLYNRDIYFTLYEEDDIKLAVEESKDVVNLLGLKSGAKILDVCCGYGRHALELAKMGFKVIYEKVCQGNKSPPIARMRFLAMLPFAPAYAYDLSVGTPRTLSTSLAFPFLTPLVCRSKPPDSCLAMEAAIQTRLKGIK